MSVSYHSLGLGRTMFIGALSIPLFYYLLTKTIPSRLKPNQAPKSKNGLIPVADYPAARDGGVDIIFVHGLGANPDTTWTAKRTEPLPDTPADGTADGKAFVNWVSDFLPDDIPEKQRKNTRLFFFNYDTYWKRDSLNTRLKTIGNDLLDRIDKIRLSDTQQSRSLIFVAHCYGGLVVKQALVSAGAREELRYLVENTRGVLFLGTPHRGTNLGSKLGWLQAMIMWPLGSNPFILAELEYDSSWLLDLQHDFARLIKPDCRIFNFFEQRPTPVLGSHFISWRLMKLLELLEPCVRPAKTHYIVPLDRVHTYTERPLLQEALRDALQIQHENASVPYAVALTGLGGTGKSQLALEYVETHKDRYSPILWIDATSEETLRSSFRRIARELGLPENQGGNQVSDVADAAEVQAVLRYLHARADADEEWLAVVDNADDFTWWIKKVMPRGGRGSVIITSRDSNSPMLIPAGCEQVEVDVMSASEASTLLFRHLRYDPDSAPETVRKQCDEIADKLGCLALAVDLAGAYVGNAVDQGGALAQYLKDFDRHRDELLKLDEFRGLKPTEKTTWTVWDTTLEKITEQHQDLHAGLLLTYLANFKGAIIQDEVFRLAALGFTEHSELFAQLPLDLQQFFSASEGYWDSFSYQRSRDLLIRYSLLRRVQGRWPGVTMHKLVQWRANHGHDREQWLWWYSVCVAAACYQALSEILYPEFRQHLLAHVPQTKELLRLTELSHSTDSATSNPLFLTVGQQLGWLYANQGLQQELKDLLTPLLRLSKDVVGEDSSVTIEIMRDLSLTYLVQGDMSEAEKLLVHVVENQKATLGESHPDTLNSIDALAIVYTRQNRFTEAEKLHTTAADTREDTQDYPLYRLRSQAEFYLSQGRLPEAEKLYLQLVETDKAERGAADPFTLDSMRVLARVYQDQGRWQEAEALQLQVIETQKAILGESSPGTLLTMSELAITYRLQRQFQKAAALGAQVVNTQKALIGETHSSILPSQENLGLVYCELGRFEEAEALLIQVIDARRAALGKTHSRTLLSIYNLASVYNDQGRLEEAEALRLQALEGRKATLGEGHRDTLMSMNNLAATYHAQGRLQEAETLHSQALEGGKATLGEGHPDTLMSMHNLAVTYHAQGRLQEAETLHSQALEVRKATLGQNHFKTLESLGHVAVTWFRQGRRGDAMELMKDCSQRAQQFLGADHEITRWILEMLESWSREAV